jgi:hypothetical protein
MKRKRPVSGRLAGSGRIGAFSLTRRPDRRRRPARHPDQFWRGAIAAWKDSGQTVTAGGAERGLGESIFFAKRRQLARRERAASSSDSTTPSPSFAAIRVIPDPTVETASIRGVT